MSTSMFFVFSENYHIHQLLYSTVNYYSTWYLNAVYYTYYEYQLILKIPLHYCVFLGFNSAGDPTAELEIMKKSSY
jgi:hypothetical protein